MRFSTLAAASSILSGYGASGLPVSVSGSSASLDQSAGGVSELNDGNSQIGRTSILPSVQTANINDPADEYRFVADAESCASFPSIGDEYINKICPDGVCIPQLFWKAKHDCDNLAFAVAMEDKKASHGERPKDSEVQFDVWGEPIYARRPMTKEEKVQVAGNAALALAYAGDAAREWREKRRKQAGDGTDEVSLLSPTPSSLEDGPLGSVETAAQEGAP